MFGVIIPRLIPFIIFIAIPVIHQTQTNPQNHKNMGSLITTVTVHAIQRVGINIKLLLH